MQSESGARQHHRYHIYMNVDYEIRFAVSALVRSYPIPVTHPHAHSTRCVRYCAILSIAVHTFQSLLFLFFIILLSFTFDSIEHYFTILHNAESIQRDIIRCRFLVRSLALSFARFISNTKLRNWMDFLEIFVETQLLLCNAVLHIQFARLQAKSFVSRSRSSTVLGRASSTSRADLKALTLVAKMSIIL